MIGIDGMRCGMCEIHVEDIIRKHMKVVKVKASHFKNQVVVICEDDYHIEDFKNVIDPTGYIVTSFVGTKAAKTIFGWR